MEGIKLIDHIEVQQPSKEIKYEIPEKQVKKKKKKLKNILKSRDNTIDELGNIDDRIFKCLSLCIKSDDDINNIIDIIEDTDDKNKLLLVYEIYNFIEKIPRDLVKVNIFTKINECILKIDKNKYINDTEIKLVENYIKDGCYFFNSEKYENQKLKEKELDTYIETPLDIASGVIICQHCGKNKTYSWEKQVRKSDEPMTTFYYCISCNKGGKFS